jgi:hypothetical protein
MDAQEERTQLEAVSRRLSSKFGALPRGVVIEAVRSAEAELQAASIRDFVPLLVEKEARDRLAELLRQPSDPVR